jgi:dolichol-phosphate mannosyltransferase
MSAAGAGRGAQGESTNSAPEFSVVVPVRNEEENILPLVAEIRAALDGAADYEIVYVDDGSSDATPQKLAVAAQNCGRLRVFRHSEGCGQSAAIRTGVECARAPWIITLDGDGQNNPADIPALLAVLHNAARPSRLELICGYREKRRDSWMKRASSRIANAARRGALKDGTPDTGCGLKVFSRQAFLALPHFDHMHRFLPALFQSAGATVISVRVNHRPRTKGRTHYGIHNRLWGGIVDVLGVMWLRRRTKKPAVVEIMLPGVSPRTAGDAPIREHAHVPR